MAADVEEYKGQEPKVRFLAKAWNTLTLTLQK